MDYFNLSENEIKKLTKKDSKILIELQQEMNSQKEIYYEKLRKFYWFISLFLLIAILFSVFAMQKDLYWLFCLQIAISLLFVLVGGKLYYIDKPEITKKAIAKSKHLDALEIEVISPSDNLRRKKAIACILFGSLIYISAFTIIFLV